MAADPRPTGLVRSDVLGPGTRLLSWRVVGTRLKPRLRTANKLARVITVPEFNVPPPVPQANSHPLDTLETRLYQAVGVRNADNGRYEIWTQHAIASPPAANTPVRSAARWYQLAPAPVTGTGAPLQVGTVDSTQLDGPGTDVHVFNGAVSPDRTGRAAAIHYNVAAANRAVEVHARSRRAGDPANTMVGTHLVLRTSRLDENTGFVSLDPTACREPNDPLECRWGDYSSATPDPNNDSVIWGTNMFVGTNPLIGRGDVRRLYRTLNFAVQPSP